MTEPLLLDEFLPTYDHVISISEVFRAPPEEVFEVITTWTSRHPGDPRASCGAGPAGAADQVWPSWGH
jgi:hypothetical protein